MGDSSANVVPSGWYNAGEFGDGNISGTDLNAAFNASLGFQLPPNDSDVFSAMDAWPKDTAGAWGGDSEILFNDVAIIRERMKRIDGDNYVRVRLPNGTKTTIGPTGILSGRADSPAPTFALLPGAVWVKQAHLMAGVITNAQPGQTVSVPVTLDLDGTNAVSGLMFSAVVRPQGGTGSAITDAAFVPAAGRPASSIPTGVTVPAGAIACYWEDLGTLMQGKGNLLGHINFTVPANAAAGQCFVVRFLSGSGGDTSSENSSNWRQPNFELIPGRVFVLSVATPLPARMPDNWRTMFFRTVDNPDGEWDADPDHDGVPNW